MFHHDWLSFQYSVSGTVFIDTRRTKSTKKIAEHVLRVSCLGNPGRRMNCTQELDSASCAHLSVEKDAEF